MTDARAAVPATGRLAILLATYNGEDYLDAQLGSLDALDWPEIDIIASDDGSSDGTRPLLEIWSRLWAKGRFRWRAGPGRGFAENFRALLSEDVGDAALVAFCDQDDLWDRRKLRIAAAAHGMAGDGPALFCSRTRLVDRSGQEVLGLSPLFRDAPCFENALVQSIAGGNTMVFNRAAHRLLQNAAGRSGFVSHDWFAYQMVSGAGGAVTYCPEPLVDYRQHETNLVGANVGVLPRLRRIVAGFGGRFTRWTDANIATLEANRELLTPHSLAVLEAFVAARHGPLPHRLRSLRQSGVFRQGRLNQIALYCAALLGKL